MDEGSWCHETNDSDREIRYKDPGRHLELSISYLQEFEIKRSSGGINLTIVLTANQKTSELITIRSFIPRYYDGGDCKMHLAGAKKVVGIFSISYFDSARSWFKCVADAASSTIG